jgi:hypothetical protein
VPSGGTAASGYPDDVWEHLRPDHLQKIESGHLEALNRFFENSIPHAIHT